MMMFSYHLPMRYTFAQAEAFYWTARLGAFRAAALQLRLSQPTISLRVKELERSLGQQLFDRDAYRPRLTSLGTAIYSDVERMLAHAEKIQTRAGQPTIAAGLLRIGAADSFAARILPNLLATLAEQQPLLQIDVTVDFSMRLEKMLYDRAIDIAFLSQPRTNDRVVVTPLWDLDLVWVIGKQLPFEGSIATPENLVHLPIFTNASPSGLFTTIQTWFGSRGLKPQRLNTCNPLTVIARLANAGTGAALLPREILDLSGEDVDLRILDADPVVPGHNLCAVWWENEFSEHCAYLAGLAKQIAES
jgi:DNA-binding transcriptional LysR family regulator